MVIRKVEHITVRTSLLGRISPATEQENDGRFDVSKVQVQSRRSPGLSKVILKQLIRDHSDK